MKATASEISAILSAPIHCGDGAACAEGVFTDTRTPIDGGLFVALKGENFDADRFAEKALQDGASIAIVARWSGGEPPEKSAVIEVEDPLFALQRLAHWWRSQLDIPVVCITGSNGKTSTKDFAFSVLSEGFKVHATSGNLNNHIGLPLTVLGTPVNATAAIYEIGMNHSGELSPLCEIARPKFGIITNIGTAHIEFLGSREAIAEEKGTLARYLPADGALFTPASCDFNEYFRARTTATIISVGNGVGSVRAEKLRLEEDGSRFDLVMSGEEAIEVFLPVPGKHMINNALLAAALGKKLGLSPHQIAAGLASSRLTTGRMRRISQDGITLIDDTYNANPESMQAALEALVDMPVKNEGKRLAVLGMMGELGTFAEAAHLELGRLAVQKGVQIIAVGKGAEGIATGAGTSHFSDHQQASSYLREQSTVGDIILFKGSRSAAIEQVLKSAFPTAC